MSGQKSDPWEEHIDQRLSFLPKKDAVLSDLIKQVRGDRPSGARRVVVECQIPSVLGQVGEGGWLTGVMIASYRRHKIRRSSTNRWIGVSSSASWRRNTTTSMSFTSTSPRSSFRWDIIQLVLIGPALEHTGPIADDSPLSTTLASHLHLCFRSRQTAYQRLSHTEGENE
jgi:hypothetical protein